MDPGSCREGVIFYYSFKAGEPARVERCRSILGENGYQTCFPLAEWPDLISSTQDIGIEPPLTYEIWKHANCAGCLRAGQQHLNVVYCQQPDVWAKAKHAEDVIGYSILWVNNNPMFLGELGPKFAAMQQLGIQADEKTAAATFWAAARKLLGRSRWKKRHTAISK